MSNDIPESAKQRACELSQASFEVYRKNKYSPSLHRAITNFARYIAQHEMESVGPELLRAREIVAEVAEGEDYMSWAEDVRAGKHDDHSEVKIALASLRHGMELAKPADDGWIEWGGGECPVPAGYNCEVKFRGDWTDLDQRPDYWRWGHDGTDSDIIAYRVVKP